MFPICRNLKDFIFDYVCGYHQSGYMCPGRPEEGIRYPGFGCTDWSECPAGVFGTEIGSSAKAEHVLYH